MKKNIVSPTSTRDSGERSMFCTARGRTHDDAELPDCALLIFQALLGATNPETKQSAFESAGAFMEEYENRRTRAQFQHNNLDSCLDVMAEEKFSGIFADRNLPINKGVALTLLRGWYLYKGTKTFRAKGGGSAIPFRLRRQAGNEGDGGGGAGGHSVKRLIGENQLYLMVVNMPPQEETKEVGVEALTKGMAEHGDA